MRTIHCAARAAGILLAGGLLAACNEGTNSGGNIQRLTPSTVEKPELPPPLSVNEGNFEAVAASALQAIVLSDASVTALDRAMNTSRQQAVGAKDMATGLRLNFLPVACVYGGDYVMRLQVENSNTNLQLDFNNRLQMLFTTEFNDCNQGGTSFTGALRADFTSLLNDVASGTYYDFEANAQLDDLLIEQIGFYPFFVDGMFHYKLRSADGVNVVTEITSDSYRQNGQVNFQTETFSSVKTVNLQTQAYQYELEGTFVGEVMERGTVTYRTVSPLTGDGYSLPSSGCVEVEGADALLLIEVQPDGTVALSLDEGKDGTIDRETTSTWETMVLSQLAVTAP